MDYNRTAEKALKTYSVKNKSIEFVSDNDNTVYKVYDNEKYYCLRLHTAKERDAVFGEKAVINSELEWLAAIARDTDITVPEPYKNINCEYVTMIDGICCSLTKWIEGRPSGFDKPDGYIKALTASENMDGFDDKEDALNFIKVLGKLHKQSSEWIPPAGFKRPEFNLNDDNITNIFADLDDLKDELYDKNNIETIKLAGRKAFEKIKTIEKNNMTWGLAHNDYAPANYIVHNHNICPIDFADCGYNYYLADLALALYFVAPSKREFFFGLYSEYFPLPDNYVSLTETLLIIRYLQTMSSYIKRKDKDEWLPKDINLWGTGEFKHYLNGEPFLFDKPAFYQGQ